MLETPEPHPLAGLAHRLQSLVAERDVEELRRCLDGERLPVLSREGDDPADIIWECITRVMQPNADWLDMFSDLTAQALTDLAQMLAILVSESELLVANSRFDHDASTDTRGTRVNTQNYWQNNENYAFNSMRLSSYLPATASLSAALNQFEKTVANIPFITIGRTPEALQTARIAQQIDDSLATRWLAQLTQALSQDTLLASSNSRAQVLQAWRALLWIPDTLENDRSNAPLKLALEEISKQCDNPATERILQRMLGLAADTCGGQAHAWREFFSESTHWPQKIKEIAQDIWPIDSRADVVLTNSGFLQDWQRLLSNTQRLNVRELIQKNDITELNKVWFDLLNTHTEGRQKLTSMLAVLKGILGTQQPRPVSDRDLRKIADEEAKNTTYTEEIRSDEKPRTDNNVPSSYEQYQHVVKVLQQIETRLRQHDWDKAEKFSTDLLTKQRKWEAANRFLSKSASSIATLWQQANRLEAALTWWYLASNADKTDPVAHNGAADTLKALGRSDEALALYQQTVKDFPGDPVARNGASDTLKALGRFDEALALYQQTVKDFPSNVVARCGAADTLKALGRTNEALVVYQQIVEDFPVDVVPRCGAADTLKALGRFDEALALYQQTVKDFPSDVFSRCGTADTLKALGRFDEAHALYQQTVKDFPSNVVARCGAADTLKALGRADEALALYQQTVKDFPSDVVARCGAADTLKALGRADKALALYQQTVKDFPSSVVARNGIADTLKALGRTDEAFALYQQTVKDFPSNVVARCGAADTLKALGRTNEALVVYQQIVEDFPGEVVPRCGAADTLKASGRADEALALYQQTVKDFPSDVVPRCGAADTLKALGRADEALALYQHTVKDFPSSVVARCGAAEALKALGRSDEALALYQQTVKDFPSNVVARNGLANLYRKRKRFSEARDLLMNQSRSSDLFDQVVLSLIDADEKKFEAAIERLQNLMDKPQVPLLERRRLLQLKISLQLRAGQHAAAVIASKELEQIKQSSNTVRLLLLHVQLLSDQPPEMVETERMYPAEKAFFTSLKHYQYDKVELAANDVLFELEYDMLLAA